MYVDAIGLLHHISNYFAEIRDVRSRQNSPAAKRTNTSYRQSRNLTDGTSLLLARRVDQDPGYWRPTDSWTPSQFTLPKGKAWKDPSSVEYDLRRIPPYRISSRSELGSGQYIYVIGEQGINEKHHVSAPIPAWNEILIILTYTRSSRM
jgi:hypothetical protein